MTQQPSAFLSQARERTLPGKVRLKERVMFNQALNTGTPVAMNIPLACPQRGARS